MCISDLIRVQATARPNATAVTQGANQVTYRHLADRAEELARALRAFGASPEVPVALCMRRSSELRSSELVIGALGILKAGSAYVPLDPTSPTNRPAMLLEDSAVPLLVTQPDIVGQRPAGKCRTIVLDENIRFRMNRPANTHTYLSTERLRTRTIGL
jgi:non-ribosomal peptide synthetase component F